MRGGGVEEEERGGGEVSISKVETLSRKKAPRSFLLSHRGRGLKGQGAGDSCVEFCRPSTREDPVEEPVSCLDEEPEPFTLGAEELVVCRIRSDSRQRKLISRRGGVL